MTNLLAQAQFSQRYSLLENSIVYWLDLKDLQHVATKGAKNIGVILRNMTSKRVSRQCISVVDGFTMVQK